MVIKLYGGCSSIGRVLDCGSRGSEIVAHLPPKLSSYVMVAYQTLTLRVLGSTPVRTTKII